MNFDQLAFPVLFFLLGICYFLAGYILRKKPPKKINPLYGYRTKRAMKNQRNWDFAQQVAAKRLIAWSIPFYVLALVTFLTKFNNYSVLTIGLLLMVVTTCLITFLQTENDIKKLDL